MKRYLKPEINIILFNISDIIVMSPPEDEKSEDDGNGPEPLPTEQGSQVPNAVINGNQGVVSKPPLEEGPIPESGTTLEGETGPESGTTSEGETSPESGTTSEGETSPESGTTSVGETITESVLILDTETTPETVIDELAE